MAEEVKHLYRVAWEDPEDPDKVCFSYEKSLLMLDQGPVFQN